MPTPNHRAPGARRTDSPARSPRAARIARAQASRRALETLESRLLMAAGSLDPTFGGDGRIVRDAGTGGAVVVQADGKVITAGEIDSPGGGGFDFFLARYNADGSPDATFGQAGTVRTDVAPVALTRPDPTRGTGSPRRTG